MNTRPEEKACPKRETRTYSVEAPSRSSLAGVVAFASPAVVTLRNRAGGNGWQVKATATIGYRLLSVGRGHALEEQPVTHVHQALASRATTLKPGPQASSGYRE
jgi:hypothetical protein